MADEQQSRAYRDADSKMARLSEDVLDKCYDIVRDLPPEEQKRLVEDWFGDDMYDAYLEWLED